MSPDAKGNIKGIAVPRLPPSMEEDRSELSVSGGSAKARENSQVPKAVDLSAWDEARNATIRKHLTQVEQQDKPRT